MKQLSEIQLNIISIVHDGAKSFNKIKNECQLESNKLAYHLKKLMTERLLEKDDELYHLTEYTKAIYPYITLFNSESTPVFSVVSVVLEYDGKYYVKRKDREPDKGSLIFFGQKAEPQKSFLQTAELVLIAQAQVTSQLELKVVHEYLAPNQHWVVFTFFGKTTTEPKGVGLTIAESKDLPLFGDNIEVLDIISQNKPLTFLSTVKSN